MGRDHEDAAVVGKHLVEAAKDRIARHGDEDQPIGFVGQGGEAAVALVLERLDQRLEVARTIGVALEGVGDAGTSTATMGTR